MAKLEDLHAERIRRDMHRQMQIDLLRAKCGLEESQVYGVAAHKIRQRQRKFDLQMQRLRKSWTKEDLEHARLVDQAIRAHEQEKKKCSRK